MLNFTEFIDMISNILPNLELKRDMPMSRLTSFRIGGPVDCAAFPKTEEELSALLKLCAAHAVEPVILGAGTNVLAPDAGLPTHWRTSKSNTRSELGCQPKVTDAGSARYFGKRSRGARHCQT